VFVISNAFKPQFEELLCIQAPIKTLVIPNRRSLPVRACPELAEGNLLSLGVSIMPERRYYVADFIAKKPVEIRKRVNFLAKPKSERGKS
jgi:hypothetical protein